MKTWKKYVSFVLAMAMTLSLAACGSSGDTSSSDDSSSSASSSNDSSSITPVTMKVSIGVAETHFEYIACEMMKEYIEEATNGSVIVELYSGNQIGADQEVFEGLPLGVAQMVPCGSDIIGNYCPEYGLLSLPYLFDDIEHVDEVMSSGFGDALLEKLDALGYVGLGFGDFGFRHISNNVRPIETVEDVSGLKIRTMTTPLHLEMFEAMGANPTPMDFSELFSALQQGVVDGQENPLSNIYSNKLHEVQKYLTLDGHVFTFVTFVVAKDWFDALDATQQQAIRDGVDIATAHMSASCVSEDEVALEAMIAEGIEVVYPTDEAMDGFREAVSAMSESNGNAINAEMYQEMMDAIEAAR